MRIGKLDYRGVRLVSITMNSVSNGGGVEKRTAGGVNSTSSEDGFAGWSGADGAEKPSDSPGKQSIAGEPVIIGVIK